MKARGDLKAYVCRKACRRFAACKTASNACGGEAGELTTALGELGMDCRESKDERRVISAQ